LEEVFTTYQEIYELPEFTHPDSEVCPAAFAYALRRRHFIILAMHSPKLGVYFRRSFDTGHLGMLLPGGGIHVDKHESVHSAIQRIARRELPSAKLRNVAPVALLRNVFTCVDGRKAEHLGLGIYALLTNGTDEVGDELKAIDVKGSFVQELDPAEIPQAPAALVYKKVLDRLQMQRYSPYTHEDDVQSQVKQRYALHRKFVSPLMNLLDFGRGAAAKKVARDAASNATSFLDVACGDNREIIYAARACPLVVANDISMAQINTLEQEYRQQAKTLPSSHALLFTNHDCLDLPFRENAFDFVLVRNLLHHMENAGDFRLLVTNLRRVGRRIAIVEIEDPSRGGFWPAIRHAYYSHWLREQGNNFFERSSFQDTIKDYFPRDKCEFKFSSTIRGVYMTAIIDKRR
jgi:SAM-dependent methyltransferase